MDDYKKLKARAIAKVKNGESTNSIAEDLNIEPGMVEEWTRNLESKDLISLEVNSIAIEKATKLIKNDEIQDKEKLKNSLLYLSLLITQELSSGLSNIELAKAINISADTISKLKNTWFPPASQNSFTINNNSQNKTLEIKDIFSQLEKD